MAEPAEPQGQALPRSRRNWPILAGAGRLSRPWLVASVALGVWGYLGSFSDWRALSIFSDDWFQLSFLAWRPVPLLQYALGGEWMLAQPRPLLALGAILQGLAFRLLGFGGIVGLAWAAYVLCAVLVARVAAPLVGARWAVVAGALFLVYPGDSTQLWFITTNVRLAAIVALLGCLEARSDRPLLAGALFTSALLYYEGTLPILLASPWLSAGSGGERRPRAYLPLASALAAWAAYRFGLFPLVANDYRMSRFAAALTHEGAWLALPEDVARIVYLGWVRWPIEAVKRCASVGWTESLLALTVVAASAPTLLIFGRRGPKARSEHLLVAGAVVTLGACLALPVARPNLSWGLESRFNFFIGLGAALVWTALAGLVWRLGGVAGRVAAVLGVGLALAAGLVCRRSVADAYVAAGRQQRHIVRGALADIGPIPMGARLVIVNELPASGALLEPLTPDPWYGRAEVRGLIRSLYGDDIVAQPRWPAHEVGVADLSCKALLARDPRPAIVYELRSRRRRECGDMTGRPTVLPGGEALGFLSRP